MQKKVIFSPVEIRVSARGLAKVFGKLHRQGDLLADSNSNPAFCTRCGAVIFATEGYSSDHAGVGATKFWCERCATGGSHGDDDPRRRGKGLGGTFAPV